MTSNQAVCACLNVVFDPIHNEDGSLSSCWLCRLCGRQFAPLANQKQLRRENGKPIVCPTCNRYLLQYLPTGTLCHDCGFVPFPKEKQMNCGTCKYWDAYTYHSFGDCEYEINRSLIPDSAPLDKRVMEPEEGVNCPCWCPKSVTSQPLG